MTQETSKQVRVRLGQVALELIDGAPEQPAIALDQRIEKMRDDTRRVRDLEDLLDQHRERDGRQTRALVQFAEAQDHQSRVVGKLFDLVDFRTRELANLFLHISTLVGTRFATGEDLERLHRRLAEIAQDFDKDASTLGEIIKVLSKDAERSSGALGQSLEEQHLTVPLQSDLDRAASEKDRGHER